MMHVINNIDPDVLPDIVSDAIVSELKLLPTKEKLVVFSKLIHGNLFKVTSNDLFNITKQIPNKVYDSFMEAVKTRVNANAKEGEIYG